ncbi:ATP-dependent RNA helicase DbpA [Teredinibacter turnerae]|uniref:DEAD-box ATP-dependent RNA helicase RhpA n=1 Tax=Teredinibacter turnerae (strain ATCC 39867 / T7901) TaxID=377629 RepID=C5BRF7_TERTT|nr:ATP-dependent RNA helicase DbpA [Teredinibacter turnerae]ACR10724.1 ATP-independent RNA helicase DbpA [Teredinibacter turnerae T7901]
MASDSQFSSLNLKPALLSNLSDLGYNTMTPIQAAALPAILQGSDVLGKAKTGSGKTATFGLGLLQRLEVERFRVQALVLCPTRELADQVAAELRKLARSIHNIKILTLCGGAAFGPQVGSLEHGAHIIVGTPGRVHDHLRKGNLQLGDLQTLVLDEADRMLDMGFAETLDAILDLAPKQRQTLLFSATYPEAIESMAKRVQHNPQVIEVEAVHSDHDIEQMFYKVPLENRTQVLGLLLQKYLPESCMVFCNTKRETQDVADALLQQGFSAVALHGDMIQKDRDRTLVLFANQSASVMVATDVAARGLDIAEVDLVVNYQLSRDPEVHVHRIGRTGRAGKRGRAVSMLNENEKFKVELICADSDASPELKNPPVNRLQTPQKAEFVTLEIEGGKKQKVRPGDIVGALTGDGGLSVKTLGKIHCFPFHSFVAVKRSHAREALEKIQTGKIKGRSFRARLVKIR